MVPWPIAFLSLAYAVLATVAAASCWKILNGIIVRPLSISLAWLVLATTVMIGLPLLKDWARRMAIASSILLALTTLAFAATLVASRHPAGALLATLGAGIHVIVIRYLRRPVVRAQFVLPQQR